MVASDRPVEQTNRDANKRVVVTSPKGQFSYCHHLFIEAEGGPMCQFQRVEDGVSKKIIYVIPDTCTKSILKKYYCQKCFYKEI